MGDDTTAEVDPQSDEIGQGLARMVFFSDAVIAIALTLLAIDLPLPAGDTSVEVWHSFTSHLNAEYFSFALSFVVIAAFWGSHHRHFQRVQRITPGVIPRNFVFLFLIVIMPFATRVLNGTTGSFGTIFYAIVVAATALVRLEMVREADRAGALRRRMTTTDLVGLSTPAVVFSLSIPIALASSAAARWSWLVLSLLGLWTVRGARWWRARHNRT